jgi:carbonic anhydrase/acetyltransferase-like protein (isoleucine patch superfamily)
MSPFSFVYVIISACIRLYNYIEKHLYSYMIRDMFKKMDGTIEVLHELRGAKYISIGKGSVVLKHTILTAWDKFNNQEFCPSITIGKNTSINEYNHITCCNSITIGDNVLTGRHVFISDNNHGDLSSNLDIPPQLRPLCSKGGVVICDNVWVGERSCILGGVTIGKGSIVAANSVVTKDVPPYCLVAGVPAQIKKRLSK